MATTRACERTSPLSTCATSQGSDPPPRYGRRARLSAAVSNRSWTTADAAAARTAPADLGQDTRPQPAARGVANDYLARGNRGLALLAFCPAEGAAGASR